jgi:Glutaminase
MKLIIKISHKKGKLTMEKERMSKYLMNALNALFEDEIENKNYEFLKCLAHIFNPAEYATPIISEATNRTFRDNIEDAVLFEIARGFTNAIIENQMVGYEALNSIFSSRYPLFKNAHKMTNDELYEALYKSGKGKKVGGSIYGAVCCCMFLKPDDMDERWVYFVKYQSFVYDKCSIHSTREMIEEAWEIDNIYNNKIFMRFMKKRREDLAGFLKCDEEQLHLCLTQIAILGTDNRNIDKEFIKLYRYCEKLDYQLNLACSNNIINRQWLLSHKDNSLPVLLDNCLNQALFEMVWDKYEEKKELGKEFTITMLIHNVTIENPEEFLKDVLTSFFLEIPVKALNESMDFAYKNFSLEKFLKYDSSSILNYKISELEASIQEKDNSLKNKKKEIDCLNSKIQHLERQLNKMTKAQESETEKKLREISNENDKLREKITIYEEFDSLMRTENEVYLDCEEEVDVTAISGKRMLFIGGRNEVVQKLKATFPNSVFVRNEIRKISFSNFERVVIFPEFMNHSMYYKYRNLIRRQGVKVVFCNTNNIEQVHKQIIMSFQEAA